VSAQRNRSPFYAAVPSVIIVTLFAPPVSAQTLPPLPPVPVFALERLELDPSALGSLALGTGMTLSRGEYRLAAGIHLERDPLVLYTTDGQRFGSVVHDRWTMHLSAVFAPHERVEIGFQLPYVPRQAGDDLSAAGYSQPAGAGVGAPLASVRVGLLRRDEEAPLDVAGEIGVGIPLASASALGRDRTFSLRPRLMASRPLGPLLASAEAGILLRPSAQLASDRVGNQLDAGASLALGDKLRGELIGRAAIPLTSTPLGFEVLGAARYRLGAAELFGLGGPGLNRNPGTPAWRVLFGISLSGFLRERLRPGPVVPAPAPLARIVTVATVPPPEPTRAPELAPSPPEPTLTPLLASVVPKEKPRVIIGRQKLEIRERIFFASDKADILRPSFSILDHLAKVILDHPELPPIVVEGHTDDRGLGAHNRKLSQERAQAVCAYLIDKGVAPGRVRPKGFGPDKPIENNKTARGRSNNRRVEFTLRAEEVVRQALEDDGPGGIK